MALRDLIVFNRAVGGIRDTAQKISSIRRARQDLERKKEIDDLTIKEKKLNIEKTGLANAKTKSEMDQDNAAFKIFEKQIKAQYDADSGKIDIVEMNEKNKLNVFTDAAKSAAQSPDVMASLLGMGSDQPQDSGYSNVARNINPNLPRISYSKKIGPYTISSPKPVDSNKVSNVDKVLGTIDSKGFFSLGVFNPFRNRGEAEKYVSSQLGYGWQKKHREVVDLLDKKFVPPVAERAKPDQFGFSTGQERTVPGKGRYQYIGDNQWKRVEIK